MVFNSGNRASKPGTLRFYLSKNARLNGARIGSEPADIPMPIGQFPQANLPAVKPNSGLRYDLVQTIGSDGKPIDLRLLAPKGQNGASYFVLAHLDYSDPLTDQMPIAKDVITARINGITVKPAVVTVTELNGPAHSGTFKVVLRGKPAADVKLKLKLSLATEIDIDKTELTFTRQNWDTPQVVTVTAKDDFTHDGTTTTTVTIGPSESTDSSWNGMSGGTVTVQATDNDPAP